MLTRSMAAKLTTASASKCLFADFLSEIEPKKMFEALKRQGWVYAMQEELNQLYRNKVWTFVLLFYGKIAIGSRCVFKNKKDEQGFVTKNKARPVAQGYSQEEGIDYNEMFAPVERMEDIKNTFAIYMNFIANPKESHLIVVNRILMYLQGAPPLGPWDHILKGDIELHFILTDILKNLVGIKSLLDVVGITAAQVYVDSALMKLMIDYTLWEVIKNDATLPITKVIEGVMTEMPITTAEEKAQRRLEDAKKLLEAVENRFGKNAATKKTLRNLLKQQYENFTTPSSEMFDQTFDMLQKLAEEGLNYALMVFSSLNSNSE
nr:hypothetical protein [Tanacetum cinerariifolium]